MSALSLQGIGFLNKQVISLLFFEFYAVLLCTTPEPGHCLSALCQLSSRCKMYLHTSVSSCSKLHIYNPNDFGDMKTQGRNLPCQFSRGCFNVHLGISGTCTPSSSFRENAQCSSSKYHPPLSALDYRLQEVREKDSLKKSLASSPNDSAHYI